MSGTVSARTVALLAVALALATPLAVATVAAHGDHVAADSQVTDDGRVVVETVSALAPGFVVLRADDGGRPGAVLGSRRVARTPNLTFLTSVSVAIDDAAWANWTGNRTMWAVLHDDVDGDGEFDRGTDLPNPSPAASTRFVVRRAESGAARVLAAGFTAQSVGDGSVLLRRVDLPTAGHVVVRPVGETAVVGSRSLSAGAHRNVTVDLNESFLADRRGDFRVRVVAHRDDGDGAFGPGDPAVTAGDRIVGTYLTLSPGEATDGPLINTPSPTAPGSGTANDAATPPRATTAGSTTDPTGGTTGAGSGGPTTASPPATDGSAGSGPGFGVGLAGLAALLGAALAASRRR